MYIIILGIVFIHLGRILQQLIEDLIQSPETIITLWAAVSFVMHSLKHIIKLSQVPLLTIEYYYPSNFTSMNKEEWNTPP